MKYLYSLNEGSDSSMHYGYILTDCPLNAFETIHCEIKENIEDYCVDDMVNKLKEYGWDIFELDINEIEF